GDEMRSQAGGPPVVYTASPSPDNGPARPDRTDRRIGRTRSATDWSACSWRCRDVNRARHRGGWCRSVPFPLRKPALVSSPEPPAASQPSGRVPRVTHQRLPGSLEAPLSDRIPPISRDASYRTNGTLVDNRPIVP